jgi:hypothetical protein
MNSTPRKEELKSSGLTLLSHLIGKPIADELYGDKNSETIRAFLEKHLDPTKPTFVVTDLSRGYPKIFKEFFGKNLTFQFGLMHLNKLIDNPKYAEYFKE